PRALESGIPRDLETVVLKAIRKEPAERYATARELADDLQRFLDGRPILARRLTLRERARRWAHRRAVPLAIAGGLLLLLTAILTISTTMTVRSYAEARNKRQFAEQKQEYAERSRAVARRAVDQVLNGVVRDWLDGGTQLDPVQQHLLEQ